MNIWIAKFPYSTKYGLKRSYFSSEIIILFSVEIFKILEQHIILLLLL